MRFAYEQLGWTCHSVETRYRLDAIPDRTTVTWDITLHREPLVPNIIQTQPTRFVRRLPAEKMQLEYTFAYSR